MLKWIAYGADTDALPERVRVAIRDQQDRSEILIGWFQLVVLVVIGSLYFLAPKTFSEDAEFAPVPWALSTYLVLTLIRLVWAHRGRLPDWSLRLSVVFDMMLLMGLIWSFHLQYMQPASFYLKAPTVLWVFIFIALRALRFEWHFVALAGLVAVIGWILMVLYVVFGDPDNMMITRDYVTYMTSNAVLIGAEVEKIFSILMVTGAISLALVRARSLLVRAIAEQTAARDLSRFFAPEIAARIKASEHEIRAGTGEMRDAAVLNLDMRGFTRLAAQMTPDAAMELLSEYQARMVPIIHKHGGSIDKFLGDGIMATFGAAAPSEHYAADALRALQETVKAAGAWREDCEASGRPCPEVNGAVTTGRVLFGAVGDETRLEYTVIGDAVNRSAKLEDHNKVMGVTALTDRQTYELALAQGFQPSAEMPTVPNATVAGIEQPVDLVVPATQGRAYL
jgi:adenylate cyclase